MKYIKPEHIPFTCKITGKYCKGDINNLLLGYFHPLSGENHKILLSIPISDEVISQLEPKEIRKIESLITTELQQYIKTCKKR